MAFHRLTWRIGLPFVLLVLLATVALALFLREQVVAEERTQLRNVADATSRFLANATLATTPKLAIDLSKLGSHTVFFRAHGTLEPPPPPAFADLSLTTVPADGEVRHRGHHDFVAVANEGKSDLVLVRESSSSWFHPNVVAMLAAFLVLAMLTAWLVVRGLVRPLRQLAERLPDIEKVGPLELPAAARNDEVGDLARAFLRTRQALHDEQRAREQMEKLAVLGRMTAALAHEVQNPVAAIRMHAQLWRARCDDDGVASIVENEASRIESLLNQWMFLTRPEPPVKTAVDVGALLSRVVDTYAAQATHTAVAVVLDAERDAIVAADGRRLDQVFRNLLTNALQAMPGGGTLTIRVRHSGDELRITFADTGVGFSPTALQRFAEFFFSEREGGMGIGLSVANEIVKAHGGQLLVENGGECGAVVIIVLPAADQVAVATMGSDVP
jgi:signal transduction histidine kinase